MKKGYTLIELVVVVAVLAVIVVAVTTLLVSAFKSKDKTNLTDVVEQNGNYVLTTVTSDFLNSDGSSAVCGVNGDSLTMVSKLDGGTTTIQCTEDGIIASNSASHPSVSLTTGVKAANCTGFVSCETDVNGNVMAVDIGFTLSAGTPGAGIENNDNKSFSAKVAVRN